MGAKQEPISPIKIKLHRPAFGRVQTLTIKSTNVGHWDACFALSQQVKLMRKLTEPNQAANPVGVALGVQKLVSFSTGETIENPNHYQASKARLTKAQQSLVIKLQHKKTSKIKETEDNCLNLKKLGER